MVDFKTTMPQFWCVFCFLLLINSLSETSCHYITGRTESSLANSVSAKSGNDITDIREKASKKANHSQKLDLVRAWFEIGHETPFQLGELASRSQVNKNMFTHCPMLCCQQAE